jgi:cardiolipin synthase
LKKEFLSGHDVTLVHSGREFFDLLVQLIDASEHSINFQTYIFDDDTTGNSIANALIRAATRGVQVSLLVDGVGSYSLGESFVNRLISAGIDFRFFSKLPWQGITQAGRRLHHKVVVFDQSSALIGGINIADKYNDVNEKAWLDYAVLVKGPIVKHADAICKQISSRRFYKYPQEKAERFDDRGIKARLMQNDWFRRKNEISAAYKRALKEAKEEIIIVASYFIPSPRLLKILLMSAKRGRKIKIVLSGQSDVALMRAAMYYLYRKLLLNNARIFEYKAAVLHAKVCIIDRRKVSIGSFNINHLSEFLSVELNVDILDAPFAERFSDELSLLMQNDCNEIVLQDFVKDHTHFRQFTTFISFKLISWSMRLLSLFYKTDSRKK